MKKHAPASLAILAALMALTACTSLISTRKVESASRIAAPSFMLERQVATNPFLITVFERVHDKGGIATVYIEGDGQAYLSKRRPSLDPTPLNPIALHLASRDKAQNVIYMARPCQYSKMSNPEESCDLKYWTTGRFAPEVINSMNMALSEIKSRYRFSSFNLVGFSGGAAVAILIASTRNDIASIRTVAGNLDPATVNNLHNVSQLRDSLNPRDVAAAVAHIPQHHFIGEQDNIVPSMVYDSYRAAAGQTSCIRAHIVHNADHQDGWVTYWPDILKAPVDCAAPQ